MQQAVPWSMIGIVGIAALVAVVAILIIVFMTRNRGSGD